MPSVFFRNYLTELSDILTTLNVKEFEYLINELTSAYERGANIFICGNGGSAPQQLILRVILTRE